MSSSKHIYEADIFRAGIYAAGIWRGLGTSYEEPTCTITAGITMAANSIATGITMDANSIADGIGMGCGNQ